MNTTITVNRAQLVKKLKDHRDKVTSEFENGRKYTLLKNALTQLDEQTEEQHLASWVTYYQEIAQGLQEGTITLSANGTARLSGDVPEKPKRNSVQLKGYYADGYYVRRSSEFWTRDEIVNSMHRMENDYLHPKVKNLDSALELLEMSSQAKVEISSADYHKLLSS